MQAADRVHSIQEYYFSEKMHEITTLEKQGKKIINLGIGNPDLPPPQAVIDALTAAAKKTTTHGYQPYKGLPELREAIADFYKSFYEVKLDPALEVLPLTGSKEGIMHIAMAYLNPGDKVLVPNPGYAAYSSSAKLVGATPLFYDLEVENNWEPNFEKLEKLDLTGVKLMWVNYPHMPTGATGSLHLFKKIIDFAKKHQILVVNDNPYSFILTKKPISILAIEGAKEVALELTSLSKSFNMAGWRIGMLSGAGTRINTVLKIKSNMDSGMFYGLQTGAIAALKMDSDWFDSLNATYLQRRKILEKIIHKIGATFNSNSSGFFLWAKLPEGETGKNMSDYLLYEKNIFVTPGEIFGSKGKNYLRFSLCVNENILQQVLTKLS